MRSPRSRTIIKLGLMLLAQVWIFNIISGRKMLSGMFSQSGVEETICTVADTSI